MANPYEFVSEYTVPEDEPKTVLGAEAPSPAVKTKPCCDAAKKLIEQERRFEKVYNDFKDTAARIVGESKQKDRVIAQLRADLRDAEDRVRERIANDRENLQRELAQTRSQLDTANAEIERLKGKPCEAGLNPDDPLGTDDRLRNLEID